MKHRQAQLVLHRTPYICESKYRLTMPKKSPDDDDDMKSWLMLSGCSSTAAGFTV